MANIFLRSPYYISQTQQGAGLSVKLNINIDGTDRYLLTKNKPSSSFVLFEVSELIRDYLDIKYNGTPLASDFNVVVILTYTWYSGLNGSGTVEGTPYVVNVFGIDAYGYHEDGSNPTTTKGYMQSNSVIYKLSGDSIIFPIDTNNTSAIGLYEDGSQIGSANVIPVTGEVFQYITISDSAVDEVRITNTDGIKSVSIVTVNECKFEPVKLSFINKFGALQDLMFFKKSTKKINVKGESYNRFTSNGDTGAYDVNVHQKQTYNVTSSKEITINTGYVSEDYNEPMEELLQSELVWMKIGTVLTPMNVEKKSMTFKTSLNDKMVDYTLDLSYSYNAINNIR
tara:strand:+ start:153 stop:1172 length:1020 start_codon:yes stop_codon:yes gene_type:complete